MLYGVIFTIYGLIFTFILLFTVLFKKRNVLIRQKLYNALIIDSMLFSVVEIISVLVLGLIDNFDIFVICWQIRYFLLFFYIFLFIAYYYAYVKEDKSNTFFEFLKGKLVIKFLLFMFILLPILYVVLFNVEHMAVDSLHFARGFACYVIVISALLFSIISIFILFKDRKNKRKLLVTMYLFMTIFLIAGPLQIKFTYISLFPFVTSLILYILYYNLENPDIELLEDVSKLKEDIDKSSSTKTDFLFNLSYDLINPMNTIVSLSNSICSMNSFNKESVIDDANNIKLAGNTLLDSINNIFEMSSNSGNSLKEYNLYDLISRMKSICETRIGSKQIKFEYKLDENLSANYVGDINKIQKILMNVLGNAVKFTDVGKIVLSVSFTPEKENHVLHFKIVDTGCGIKDEEKSFIFSDDDSSKSGVGLAVSKKYVEEMNGHIRFESIYGGGTTFYIDIPQAISGTRIISDNISSNDVSSVIEYTDLSKYKVLIVDDDNLDIKVTKRLLEKYNLQIEECMSTIKFIDKIKADEIYDIVFLDHKMNELDGVETVKLLRSLDGYTLPKIVSLTANASGGAREYYKSVGFDDYISKPIDKYMLDKILKKYLKK